MMKLFFPILLLSPFMLDLLTPVILLSMLIFLYLLKPNLMMILSKILFWDHLSTILILLSLTSVLLIMMSSNNLYSSAPLMMIILLILILTFSFSNIFYFYISFEFVLIPTFILITKNGYQPERLQAGMYLLLYTVFASLPLLLGMLTMPSMNFLLLFSTCLQIKFIIIFLLAFLVKMPMFFVHLWLPKAHVEAPVEGSMILAAVLLKLGGYGIIRFSFMMMSKLLPVNFWIISISMLGAIMSSMSCIRQKDLKSLIAYSSVAHMGLTLASILTFSYIGMNGATIMMVAHGISSSALFFMVNIIYSKHHTRNVMVLKGLFNSFPNITFWWFIFIAINISAPPSINLAGEILMLTSLVNFNMLTSIPFIFMSLMASAFSIILFLNSIHNQPNLSQDNPLLNKYYFSLFMHFFIIIMLISNLDFLSPYLLSL